MMTLISHTVHAPHAYSASPERPARPGTARLLRLFGMLAGMLCLLALPGLAALPAGTARAETAEWTVMLCMCGTDLESKHGLGTYNLNDIASMWFPKKVTARTENGVELTGWSVDGVNLVVQTGGARKWHGLEPDENGRIPGLDIATDRLSRHAVDIVESPEAYISVPSFTLVDEQPWPAWACPTRSPASSDGRLKRIRRRNTRWCCGTTAAAAGRVFSWTSRLTTTSCTCTSWARPWRTAARTSSWWPSTPA